MQFDENKTREDYGIKELKSYKHILKRFFLFYSADFYESQVICTFDGKMIHKDDYPKLKNSTNPVTIPAPLLRWSNVAKHMRNLDIGVFMDACKFSYNHLCKYQPKDTIDKYFNINPYEYSFDDEE